MNRFLALFCIVAVAHASPTPLPVILQVDGLGSTSLVTTDSTTPRLTWTPDAPIPDLRAWQLTINRTDAPGATYTRIIPASDGPWHILDSLPLPSRAAYTWQIEALVGPANSNPAPTPNYHRATGHFEVGLKKPADWRARWISLDPKLRARSAPLFRKTFDLKKPVSRARLYATGLGWHEAHLNGQRLDTASLSPAQTDYEHRVFYLAHDVTSLLQTGANALAFWVGDGWFNQDRVWGSNGLSYGQPRLLAQLEITHPDGSITKISTDGSWAAAPSAITNTNVYQGEDFDARLHDPLWNTATFDDTTWPRAQLIDPPGGHLLAQTLPNTLAQRTLPVRTWTEPTPGTYIADFGQNLTGLPTLKLRATPGTKVTLRFAESINTDGTLDPTSTGVQHTKKTQTDTFICRGNQEEIFQPRFTFHAYQYAELTISDGQLLSPHHTPDFLVSHALFTAAPIQADFSCSDPIIQRLYELADWTLIGNMQGLPSDCPGRERCGWTGDAHLLAPFALRRYDSAAFWNKYQADIQTSASTEGIMLNFGRNFGERFNALKKAGLPTMIAPGKRTSGAASPDWGSAIVFIPWDIYQHTGDTRALLINYPSFIQWVEYLRSISTNHIVSTGLGDWCTPWRADSPRPSEPRDYYGRIVPELSTACYWRSTDILARSAHILGRHEDAAHYRRMADEIAAAYLKKFQLPNQTGFTDQTINAITIDWGLLPANLRAPVAAHLSQQIKNDQDHFYTGVFGLTSLFSALGDHGHHDTIARIFSNPAAPGFRYLLAQGATTFWEVFPAKSDEGKPYSRSKSHPFQGAWANWCFEGIAGLSPTTPGFREFHLAPQMTRQLDWARLRERTPMGWAESSWKRTQNKLTWTIEIPPGATATLTPPGKITTLRRLDHSSSPAPAPDSTSLTTGRYELSIDL